jgi:hypothetical protein
MQYQSPDKLIPDPYNPQDWNRYSYARNNPLNYKDPSGHVPVPDEEPPSDPIITLNSEHGLCINAGNIGCSGGESYRIWWKEWYLPRMDDYILQDVGTIARYGADPLNFGLDAYETWRGIPLPKNYGYGIDFFAQLAQDAPRQDLTYSQRFGRAAIHGIEGAFISGISSIAGEIIGGEVLALSFEPAVTSGQVWLPPVAFWASYTSTYLAVNYTLGEVADQFNTNVWYPLFDLGEP